MTPSADKNDTYSSNKAFSYILMAIFGGIALCSAFYIVICFLILFVPDMRMRLDNGMSLHSGYFLIGTASSLESLLRLLAIIFFLIWEYRAFKNLAALKAKHTEFSPGWAVGWWFVPLANLVKPMQAVSELWNESDPEFDEEMEFLHVSGGTPKSIGFWWATFLLSGIIGRLVGMLIDPRTGMPSNDLPAVLIVASFFQLAAALLILFIVKDITARQEQRFNKIAATQQFSPPPPDFYQNS